MYNARGTSSLAMCQIELPLDTLIEAGSFAQEFRDPKNSGERIVQFMGDAGQHLAHGGKFFRLDELFLQTLKLGDVAAGNDHAVNPPGLRE